MNEEKKAATLQENANKIVLKVKELNDVLRETANEGIVQNVRPQKVQITPTLSCIQFECQVYERKAMVEVDTPDKFEKKEIPSN